jgi:hypothetical protein
MMWGGDNSYSKKVCNIPAWIESLPDLITHLNPSFYFWKSLALSVCMIILFYVPVKTELFDSFFCKSDLRQLVLWLAFSKAVTNKIILRTNDSGRATVSKGQYNVKFSDLPVNPLKWVNIHGRSQQVFNAKKMRAKALKQLACAASAPLP